VTSRGRIWVCLLVPALLVTADGCTAEPAAKKAKKASVAGAAAVATETLPAIDPDAALTVDGGRLSVSPPKGWARGSRSKDYLVRYTPTAQKTYPAITVTAADPPDGHAQVTAATHDDFVARVAANLAETFSKDGTSTLVRQPAAVTLGEHLGVSYAAPGEAPVGGMTEPVDCDFLAAVINGRLVTVEVRAPKGKLDSKARLAAKAVAMAIGAPRAAGPTAGFGPPQPPAAPAAEQPQRGSPPGESADPGKAR